MSGYLKVMSRDGSWDTHYAVVKDAMLRCWRTKEAMVTDEVPGKEVDLNCATLCEVEEGHTWSVQPQESVASYFQCESEARKVEWITALRNCGTAAASSPKKVSLRDFQKVFVLGKGSYGKVYMVTKRDTGKSYAMKEMSAEKMRQAEIKAPFMERLILQEIDHPFIVHLHYSFQENGFLYMILDLLGGGELFTYIESHAPLPEETGKYYAAEVATALGYLHSRNIIYRDLKPENVVFDQQGHACLTDFGLAKANVFEANAVTYCGTNEYLAPELLKGVPHGKAVDWWSLGLMLCEMIFNELPFYDDNPVQMQTRILQEEVQFPQLKVPVSEPTKDLIRRLLDKDPGRRLQTLEEFMAHPCFEGLDFDLLLQRKLPPPITPNSDPARNFSPEFTSEVIYNAPMPAPVPSHGVRRESNDERSVSAAAAAAAAASSSSTASFKVSSPLKKSSSMSGNGRATAKRNSLSTASNSHASASTSKSASPLAGSGRKGECGTAGKASPVPARRGVRSASGSDKPGK